MIIQTNENFEYQYIIDVIFVLVLFYSILKLLANKKV